MREPAPLNVALIAWGLMLLGWSALADIVIGWGFRLPQNFGSLVLSLPLGVALYRGDDLARKITLFLGFLIAAFGALGAISGCIGALHSAGNPMAMAAAISEMVTMSLIGALGFTTGVLLRNDATVSWCRRQQRHAKLKGRRISGLLFSAAAIAVLIQVPQGVQRKAWASAYSLEVDIVPVDQVSNEGLRQGSLSSPYRNTMDQDLPSIQVTTSGSAEGLTYRLSGIAIEPLVFAFHAEGYASQTITIDRETSSRLTVPMVRTSAKP